ncbi:MAG: glycoside hydrolase family 32 protein [Nitrososphaerota archaeon]|nr:glycoside hydrolase family 32 protein [Candidatus Calditenuaceae archaeon]MDW8073785.1 glycoside hydrolase family 32 protein [Nitrososphaerota archaeon]
MKTQFELLISGRYLNFPVKAGSRPVMMRFFLEGKVVREFEIELAREAPDFWVFSDFGAYRGRNVVLEVEGDDVSPRLAESLPQSEGLTEQLYPSLYRERYRPQYHFTTKRGWINDPNGLVYYKGEYHLFYQHNPYGTKWGNMHWGHAVAPDLLHWRELGDALEPDELGTIFSGSAVVDWRNTSGLQRGEEPPIILVYTSAGNTSPMSRGRPFTVSIAYSNDAGRTWTKYERNPVLPNIVGENRDPKVFWHERSKKWIMALYLDKSDYALFSSPNLKEWNELCRITVPGSSECPDMFEMPIDGDHSNTKWVFWVADGRYVLGSFDGERFIPESEPKRLYWGHSYAGQTWSDVPAEDGRRIQITWMRTPKNFPGMPFNQQMTIPCELELRSSEEELRLTGRPVREISSLYRRAIVRGGFSLTGMEDLSSEVGSDLLDIKVKFQADTAQEFGFIVKGAPISCDVKSGEVTCLGERAPIKAGDGEVSLRILVDRTSVEVLCDDGAAILVLGALFDEAGRMLEIYSRGGRTRVEYLEIYELGSIWGGH